MNIFQNGWLAISALKGHSRRQLSVRIDSLTPKNLCFEIYVKT